MAKLIGQRYQKCLLFPSVSLLSNYALQLCFFTRRNSLRPSYSLSFLGLPPILFLENICVLGPPTGFLHKWYMCVFETFVSLCNALMDVFLLNLTYAMVSPDKNLLPAILQCYFTICLLQLLVTSFDIRFILND